LDLRPYRVDNGVRDLVLEVEHIVQIRFVTVGPDVGRGLGVNQLPIYTDTVPGPADAALEHIADTQFLSHPADIDCQALVAKGRVAGDDEQPGDKGEGGNDLLAQPVGKILLLGLARNIDEGQDRDGGLAERCRPIGIR
jgi:hypothetical protein